MEHAGQIVDLYERRIYPGAIITQEDGTIVRIEERPSAPATYLMPGFVDAHVHIESSMLVPSQFAKLAVRHGTVATVSDPHEIANVLGKEGVYFMISDGETVPFKFYFGAPSCVPATPFETAGATIDVDDVSELLDDPRVRYLSEMMNFPGVVQGDPSILAKINAAIARGKPVDGHAPLLGGDDLATYVKAGIETDHECTSLVEAREKQQLGMKILIREGSAARNYAALSPLLAECPDDLMFCSDDKHPDELVRGHINTLAARAVADGYDLFDVLTAACLNPVEHYGLPVGGMRPGDPADFIRVHDLRTFTVAETWIDGALVANDHGATFSTAEAAQPNQFNAVPISPRDIKLWAESETARVIVARDGELITDWDVAEIADDDGTVSSDVDADLLKIVVINRYQPSKPAVALIRGFGLKSGAIASSVAHDSHNVVVVGVSDEAICKAANGVIQQQGGISVASAKGVEVLPLPVAGLMSTLSGEQVAASYEKLDGAAKALGSSLRAPFMTLSFMALLVIPYLKLSDKGLFDGSQFKFVRVFHASE